MHRQQCGRAARKRLSVLAMTPSLAAIADTLEARSKAAKLLDRAEMLDLAKTLREIDERFGGNVLRFRKRGEGAT
jgi:hypothetical protein